MHAPFSYAYYCELIQTLTQLSPLKDFTAIQPSDDAFFILRHDVEFSVERAFELAKIEHDELKITASYFFQTRNNAYNVLSWQNIALIKKIYSFGHAIGLHVNSTGLATLHEIKQCIQRDIEFLSHVLAIRVDRFSFHRPTPQLLRANLKLGDLVNAYGTEYFPCATHPDINIYYFSDSEHRWKYGHPSGIAKKKIKKFQLLIHPDSWSVHGSDNVQNFQQLIAQKYMTMLNSINEECHHFPAELLHEKL